MAGVATVAGVAVLVRGGAAVSEPPTGVTKPFAGAPSSDPAPVPRARHLFARYLTGSTVALVTLILAADLYVLLLRPSLVGPLAALVVAGPLVAVLLGVCSGLVNSSAVWRMACGAREPSGTSVVRSGLGSAVGGN